MKSDRVLVVGAGPVGVTLALLLAQRGLPVTVLEAEAATDHRLPRIDVPSPDNGHA